MIGRFLEHSRIFYFHNKGHEKIYCSSADLMERNLYHRVEVCFPIEKDELKQKIKHEVLELMLDPDQKRWQLESDGSYQQHGKLSCQEILLSKYTQ